MTRHRVRKCGAEQRRPRAQRIKSLLVKIGILGGFAFILTIGLTIMFYPQISDYINRKNASRVVDMYRESLKSHNEEEFARLLAEARAYNARLAGSGATIKEALEFGAESKDRTGDYWKLLDINGNGMIGYIEIKDLDIRLPMRLGTSESVLAKNVGHIQGTSAPVGGASTHAVLTGHTGLPSVRLFTGIDRMTEGDTFTLYVLNEVLTYRVGNIITVLPYEVDALKIEKGSDYVTLVTCTPYGINSHRLLIRGVRIETPPELIGTTSGDIGDDDEAEGQPPSWFRRTIDGLVAFLALIVENVAKFLVGITEWGMDLFGIEY